MGNPLDWRYPSHTCFRETFHRGETLARCRAQRNVKLAAHCNMAKSTKASLLSSFATAVSNLSKLIEPDDAFIPPCRRRRRMHLLICSELLRKLRAWRGGKWCPQGQIGALKRTRRTGPISAHARCNLSPSVLLYDH